MVGAGLWGRCRPRAQGGNLGVELASAPIVGLHRLGDHSNAGAWLGVFRQVGQPDVQIDADERDNVIDMVQSRERIVR